MENECAEHVPVDYLGIVAVDAERFSERSDIAQGQAAEFLVGALATSFQGVGLGDVWKNRLFPAHRGDGYAFGFDYRRIPEVVGRWLDELQEVLMASEPSSGGPLRLRVSLNAGPLPAIGGLSDGTGTARNETHRLLNARVLKQVLAGQSSEVTRVAAIMSDRCFTDVVRSGRALHPDRFVHVTATVEDKRFEQSAWIYVPVPSGNLLAAGVAALAERKAEVGTREEEASNRPCVHVVGRGTVGNVNTGVIGGNQSGSFHC
ncbi:hypothetical protein [Actinomadura atramentaria]|uniref:hypothetical protein n=1 Tax=Actinomadura atramentaria TaxID=1990 RepID=UPI00036EF3FB|nr:hypothetical protein [Actinomadura atramentaria]